VPAVQHHARLTGGTKTSISAQLYSCRPTGGLLIFGRAESLRHTSPAALTVDVRTLMVKNARSAPEWDEHVSLPYYLQLCAGFFVVVVVSRLKD